MHTHRRIVQRLEHIALGLAVDQAAGVSVRRVAEYRGDGAFLDQVAVFHHQHAVGKTPDHVQVVRDQQNRHAVFVLQAVEQIQYLAAQRHIQRGGRLVGQQELGLTSQGHGNHGALSLHTGELVRVAVDASLRFGDAGVGQ